MVQNIYFLVFKRHCFSDCKHWTSNICWELVKNADRRLCPIPTESETFSASLPGDSDAHESWRTTGKGGLPGLADLPAPLSACLPQVFLLSSSILVSWLHLLVTLTLGAPVAAVTHRALGSGSVLVGTTVDLYIHEEQLFLSYLITFDQY